VGKLRTTKSEADWWKILIWILRKRIGNKFGKLNWMDLFESQMLGGDNTRTKGLFNY
jgi:hypothetical protein